MRVFLLLLLLLALTPPKWWRESNSHAQSSRGERAYADKKYTDAAKAYAKAHEMAPSRQSAFNLGTAEIAAGQREQGANHLAEAIRDPALRADALFNRGNSALAAKALDHAVRDYIAALKANPAHAAAKRNLEIALNRKQQQQRSGSSGKDQQGNSGNQQQKPQQGEGQQKPKEGNVDLEALLRSVQQQEQEELRRMRGRAAEGKVGW